MTDVSNSSSDSAVRTPNRPVVSPTSELMLGLVNVSIIRAQISTSQSVAHQRVHAMVCRTKSPKLYVLAVRNLLGVRIAPFDRNVAIRISIHKHIECTVAAQLRQERDRRGDLPKDGRNLRLDLRLRLVGVGGRRCAQSRVFLILCGRIRFGLGFRRRVL